MDYATDKQIGDVLKKFGTYRIGRTIYEAPQPYDAYAWLALGCRETWLQNIEGGARLVNGEWVKETDPTRMDVGVFQISRIHQADALKKMKPAVKAGTWSPYFDDKSAYDGGFCPRFEESVVFMGKEFQLYRDYAKAHGVPSTRTFNFAICAHNAGAGGAMAGWRDGGTLADFDRHTSGGDYVSWVRHTMIQVEDWLEAHPNWLNPIAPTA